MDEKELAAVNFFTFATIGVDLNDDFEIVLKGCIRAARRDALGQGAFYAIANIENFKSEGNDIDELYKDAESELKERIDGLIRNHSCYNHWHKETCDSLCDLFSGVKRKKCTTSTGEEEAFSVGNAQKWVNMTMKYLSLVAQLRKKYGMLTDSDVSWSAILDCAPCLHIPLDNYILGAVSRSKKSSAAEYVVWADGSYQIKDPKKEISGSFKWSQIDNYDVYCRFQEQLKDVVSPDPLLWENEAWIGAAKERFKK